MQKSPHYSETEITHERWLDRRRFLGDLGTGLGSIALAALLADDTRAAGAHSGAGVASALSSRAPHRPAKAKRVVQIFCPGAASSIDLFDYKPELAKRHGTPLSGDKIVTFQGANGNITRSPFGWKQHGQCGKWISDILPHLAGCMDDIAFIHSLTARSNTHGPAMLQMNTGFILEGFPSMGAWATYALGAMNQDLPAFVAIPDIRGLPVAGPANWTNGFLPAAFQGTAFNTEKPIPNLQSPQGASPAGERALRGFLQELNGGFAARNPGHGDLSARVSAYELAARMQLSAPEVTDISREPATTLSLYGADSSNPLKAAYARNCILARRLLERGVRFVQLYCGASSSNVQGLINWDAHDRLKEDLERHCPILDQPSAALLIDLKRRGMLEDTLVLWTTEFGRMPTFQAQSNGRDHNPFGFTAWMAGGGARGGTSFGATDELGYKAAENVSTIYDFHATVLHLLGLDHEKLTYYHNGIQRRLTDVHGHVIEELCA